MDGRILVVDGASTSRILLKVQLSSAYSVVSLVSTAQAALEALPTFQPDLVLFSDELPDMTGSEFCRTVQTVAIDTRPILVGLIRSPDQAVRTALLAAGAEDLFSRTQPEELLLARLRALMRARGTEEELSLRQGAVDALGLSEPSAGFEARLTVLRVDDGPGVYDVPDTDRRAQSPDRAGPEVLRMGLTAALRFLQTGAVADVIAINLDRTDRRRVLRLIADARSRRGSRHAEILLYTANDQNRQLADALDQGANSVIVGSFDEAEVDHRIAELLRRKVLADRIRQRMHDGLRESVTDPMTGLYNRRYADHYLGRLVQDSQSTGRPFSIILADVDHFKAVNDRYGHATGDATLILIADCLRDNLRARDLVARFGGEEFLIVMPDTAQTEARIVADRLRRKLAGTEIRPDDDGDSFFVTISMGLCSRCAHPDRDATGQVALMTADADRALYDAKASGRNAIAVAAQPA